MDRFLFKTEDDMNYVASLCDKHFIDYECVEDFRIIVPNEYIKDFIILLEQYNIDYDNI